MRFSKKTAHRIIISLAMVFPIAYMLGTQIAVLAGSHGEQLLAQPVYVEGFVTTDSFVAGGTYRYTIDDSSKAESWSIAVNRTTALYPVSMTVNGVSALGFYDYYDNYIGYYTGTNPLVYTWLSSSAGADFVLRTPLPWVFVSDDPLAQWYFLPQYGSLEVLTSVPSEVIYENNSAYTELLFGNIFMRDNFVSKIGSNAISENPKGFAPFGAMLRYLDLNALHAGDTQVGLMFYGMVYWMLHVVFADLVYHVLVFIINLIMAVFNWFGHGLDDDSGND